MCNSTIINFTVSHSHTLATNFTVVFYQLEECRQFSKQTLARTLSITTFSLHTTYQSIMGVTGWGGRASLFHLQKTSQQTLTRLCCIFVRSEPMTRATTDCQATTARPTLKVPLRRYVRLTRTPKDSPMFWTLWYSEFLKPGNYDPPKSLNSWTLTDSSTMTDKETFQLPSITTQVKPTSNFPFLPCDKEGTLKLLP